MSKVIKQMQMESLRRDFGDVRDLLVLSVKGLSCLGDHTLRANLRKKNIRLRVVKNSLTRKVFGELGFTVDSDPAYWLGPTTLAWGGSSIADLSRALEGELKAPKTAPLFRDKVTIKGAFAEGQPVPFDRALKMPTRAEAIARVVGLALAPASRLVSQIRGPASRVASQVKTVSEKAPAAAEAAPAPEAAPPPA